MHRTARADESMPPWRSIGGSLWSFWRHGRKVERAGYLIGALLLLSGLIHLAVLVPRDLC